MKNLTSKIFGKLDLATLCCLNAGTSKETSEELIGKFLESLGVNSFKDFKVFDFDKNAGKLRVSNCVIMKRELCRCFCNRELAKEFYVEVVKICKELQIK
jgi:hypothetical protein